MYYTYVSIHLPPSPRQALACPVAPAASVLVGAVESYICVYARMRRDIYTIQIYLYIYLRHRVRLWLAR